MATILFDRHVTTTASTIDRIERVLNARYDLLHVPMYHPSAEDRILTWVSQNAMQTDLFVGCDYRIVRHMRRHGWRGHILWTAHADLPHGASGLRTVLPFLWRTDVVWVASRADKGIYESLVTRDGAHPEEVYLPYGLDFKTPGASSRADRQRLRMEWGIAPEEFVVVYAGRIVPQKNVHSTIEAIYYLSLERPNVKFVIAGRFEEMPFREFGLWVTDIGAKFQRVIDRLHLADRVKFVGWLDQERMNELYAIGDVLVNLTLDTDNFGNAQVEAMGAGLPVIGTAWGALKDTVIDGHTGFLADTWVSQYGIRFDMLKVVKALDLMATAPVFRSELGAWASQHVRRRYSMSSFSERLFGTIDALLSTAPQESRAQLTKLGESLQSRFSTADPSTGDRLGTFPRFRCLWDQEWTQLIAPYSSLKWPNSQCGDHLSVALPGRLQDKFYYSNDLLWPVRISVDKREAMVMNQLNRYPGVSRRSLDCPEEVIRALVRKGLVAMSCWDPFANSQVVGFAEEAS